MGSKEEPSRIEARQALFELDRDRLEHFSYRAIHLRGLQPSEFVAICIEVDDPAWTDLANHLVPNGNWQELRDRGQIPVARGTAMAEGIMELLRGVVPDIAPALDQELPPGAVRAIVCGSGGASVYFIEPTEHLIN